MIDTKLMKLMSKSSRFIISQVIWKYISLIAQIIFIWSLVKTFSYILSGYFENIFIYVLVTIICIIVKDFALRMSVINAHKASAQVKSRLRDKMYEKILRIGARYKDSYESAELLVLMGEGVDSLETYYGLYLPQLIYSTTAPLILFAFLAQIDLKSSLVLLVLVPLIPLTIMIIQRIARRIMSRYLNQYANLSNRFLDYLTGLTTLKVYEAELQALNKMDREAEKFRRSTMRVLLMQLNSIIVMDLFAYVGAGVGILMAISRYTQGLITLEGTLIIALLAAEFFLPLRQLGSYFHVALNGIMSSRKIFRFLSLKEPARSQMPFPVSQHGLMIQNVSYRYDQKEVLHDLNMRIPQGSFIGVVGKSGSGKSTLAGILMKRHTEYDGRIKVGSRLLDELNEDDYFQHVTYVSSDHMVFKGRVRDNLNLGEAFEDQYLNIALNKVNLGRELTLDTRIEEGGRNLSGGQRQRLCLARALLHDSDIYIFDEATSHIDVESEALIMSIIEQMAKFKTVIMMTHRLSNVKKADRIYLLEDGRIVEDGDHLALMALRGRYYEMYSKQELDESFSRRVQS